MPHVTVKQKYQVTIPAVLRKKLHLHEGDMLEATEHDGAIVLTPQVVTSKKQSDNEKKSLGDYLGSASGLLSSVEDIDRFIRHERQRWES